MTIDDENVLSKNKIKMEEEEISMAVLILYTYFIANDMHVNLSLIVNE